MFSWIVASHRPDILHRDLLPTLPIVGGDELVVVENAASITLAYAEGQERATEHIRVYIHSDVQILNLNLLRKFLLQRTITEGIVGVIGSRTLVMPWWHGELLGSVQDSRLGTLNYGPGGQCEVVDGMLLATRKHINWDLSWPGWHGYDMDACAQMLKAGNSVWCLSNGHEMVRHNSDSPLNEHTVDGWDEAVARYTEKWLSVPS